MRLLCPPVRSSSPPPRIPTTRTTTARCIASIRCGSRMDCNPPNATASNPERLHSRPLPLGRSHHRRRNQWPAPALQASTTTTTNEGSTAMGFYNVQQGDAPYLKSRRQLFDERQLPPGRYRRHRSQSRDAGHRRRHLVPAMNGNPARPPAQSTRAAGSPERRHRQ